MTEVRGLPMVYVAAPYTIPDPVENTAEALRVATYLLDTGLVIPFVPHLTMFWHLCHPHDYDVWLRYDMEVLKRCDALLRLPGESTGADGEVRIADMLKLQVFTDQADVPPWAERWINRASYVG